VEAVFPEFPHAGRAGWGYLLLPNMLPDRGNGVFTIQAIAEDAEGNASEGIGSRYFTVANRASLVSASALSSGRCRSGRRWTGNAASSAGTPGPASSGPTRCRSM
jgi:hypothetical protein